MHRHTWHTFRGLHYIIGQSPQVFPFVYLTALANTESVKKNNRFYSSGYTMKNSWSEVKSSSKITITGWNLTKVMVKEKVKKNSMFALIRSGRTNILFSAKLQDPVQSTFISTQFASKITYNINIFFHTLSEALCLVY